MKNREEWSKISHSNSEWLQILQMMMMSDGLQLIKFWPSRAPGRGSAVGRKFLALPYYSQCAVFASPLSAFFIVSLCHQLCLHHFQQLFLSDFHSRFITFSPVAPIYWLWTVMCTILSRCLHPLKVVEKFVHLRRPVICQRTWFFHRHSLLSMDCWWTQIRKLHFFHYCGQSHLEQQCS